MVTPSEEYSLTVLNSGTFEDQERLAKQLLLAIDEVDVGNLHVRLKDLMLNMLAQKLLHTGTLSDFMEHLYEDLQQN